MSSSATWRLFFSHGVDGGADSSIRFESKALGPAVADTTLASWSRPATKLYTYLNNDNTVRPWYATEHLKAGNVDFMAAFNAHGIGVSRMYWKAPPNERDFFLRQPVVSAVDELVRGPDPGVELRVSEMTPGRSRVGFEIELVALSQTKLTLYDVMGRRVKVLVDRVLPMGKTAVTWDGTNATGYRVGSGVLRSRFECLRKPGSVGPVDSVAIGRAVE